MKIKTFNPANLEAIRKDFAKAVKSLEKEYGIVFNMKRITYENTEFSVKLQVMVKDPSAGNIDPRELEYRNNVAKHGWKFGISNAMIGKKVVLDKNGLCTLIGCASRYKKYPLVFKRPDGMFINATTKFLRDLK